MLTTAVPAHPSPTPDPVKQMKQALREASAALARTRPARTARGNHLEPGELSAEQAGNLAGLLADIVAPVADVISWMRGTRLGQGSACVGGHEGGGGRQAVLGPVVGSHHSVGAGEMGAQGTEAAPAGQAGHQAVGVDADGTPRTHVTPAPYAFFTGLCAELAGIVDALPASARDQCTVHRLPTAHELEELLSPLRVTPRTPSLLHGDLHPWNLVRLPGSRLSLIDWQLALVGDPLYEIVRHGHLTPTTAQHRATMLNRWASRLPANRTAGWQHDAPVYACLERIRSAYIDLDRITSSDVAAPNVARAAARYPETLAAAHAAPVAAHHQPRLEAGLSRARALTSPTGHPRTAGSACHAPL